MQLEAPNAERSTAEPRSKRGASGVAPAAADATNAARPKSLLDVAPLTADADKRFHAAAGRGESWRWAERWSGRGRVRRWAGGTTLGCGESCQVTVHACHPAGIVGGRRQAVLRGRGRKSGTQCRGADWGTDRASRRLGGRGGLRAGPGCGRRAGEYRQDLDNSSPAAHLGLRGHPLAA